MGTNATHVVTASSVNANARLDGFTITAGNAGGASNNCPATCGGGLYTVNEGSPLALNGSGSTDDGSIVSYGWDCTNDGSIDVTSASPTGSTCTYPNSGSYTLRLAATDNLGAAGSATTNITVNNVAPLYTPAPNQSTGAGNANAFTLGSFTDPGAEGSWAIHVDWGDDSTPTEFTVDSTGPLPDKSHVYVTQGSYSVVVTISDDHDRHSDGFQATINPPPPGAPNVSAPANQNGTVATANTFALGSFTDPGSSGPWQITVDWGDGSPNTLFTVTSAGEIPAQPHTYAEPGQYEVFVTISDGALSASANFLITIPAQAEGAKIYLPTARKP